MARKDTVIIYHGRCPDGFGGAYAAWKKFGDSVEYIPTHPGNPIPNDMDGRELYLVDMCYNREKMDELAKVAKSIVVLDHHEGVKDVAVTFPGIFDASRSGATIAWSYFHPDTPVPLLLQYVQEGDLYTFKLQDSRPILSYAYAQPMHFDMWDSLAAKLEDEKERATIIERGKVYTEYFSALSDQIANRRVLVSFEGYECYLTNAGDMFTSDVGKRLFELKPPISLTTAFRGDTLNVSLRSDGTVDVAALARKYGGNGHPKAAGFRIPWGAPLPWTIIEHEENIGH